MPVMTKTPQGDDIVILSRAEYDGLVAGRREDAADAAHANHILADIESGAEILLTSEQANRLLNAKTPLAFWRKHRNMTQQALAQSIGVAQGFISAIENGAKTGDVQTLAAIARVLGITLDDLVIPRPAKSSTKRQRPRKTFTKVATGPNTGRSRSAKGAKPKSASAS